MAKDLTRVIAVLSTWTKSNTGLQMRLWVFTHFIKLANRLLVETWYLGWICIKLCYLYKNRSSYAPVVEEVHAEDGGHGHHCGAKKLEVNVSFGGIEVMDLTEKKLNFELKFKVVLSWLEHRLEYHNLHGNPLHNLILPSVAERKAYFSCIQLVFQFRWRC